MWPNPQFPADLVTFTEEILNGKFHFLRSAVVWKDLPKLCSNIILERVIIKHFLLYFIDEIFCFESFNLVVLILKSSRTNDSYKLVRSIKIYTQGTLKETYIAHREPNKQAVLIAWGWRVQNVWIYNGGGNASQFSFHHKWKEAWLLVIHMVYTSCPELRHFRRWADKRPTQEKKYSLFSSIPLKMNISSILANNSR